VEVNERHGYAANLRILRGHAMADARRHVRRHAVLQRLARGGPLEARATLALGFLTLAAYVAGTLAQRLRLPRIVGYLVTGLVAGPAWLRLVHADEVQALAPIASGALSLIAFAVGSELTAEVLRGERRRTVGRIVASAITVPFAAVMLVVLTVSPWFPLTAHQPFRDALPWRWRWSAGHGFVSHADLEFIHDLDARGRYPARPWM